jgi:sulfur transfer complex TusBCD TusB component (DsrH family)
MSKAKIIGNDFKIKFDGQQHQVDANVLVSSLIHTTTIVQEVNKYLNSGKKIEIKVKALEKGSFLCHIELVETTIDSLKNLLTKDNIEVGAAIVTTVVGIIELKKFLKGKKAKEVQKQGDRTKIINKDGNVLIIENATFNIYEHSPVVKDALAQNFDALNNDPAITGFEITDKNENALVRVDKSEFVELSQKSEEVEEGERKIVEAATVNVVRVSFEESLKWDFYYRGIKISAKIADPSFYELIDKGEAFAKGDVLEVELQIHQKFDESVNTFVTKSYTVNKIVSHLSRNEQQKINFKPEE